MEIYKNKKLDFICIIEARMNSSRLPGKVLKKFCNTNILEIIANRLNRVKFIKSFVISTSSNHKDKKIIKFCQDKKIKYFIGSEHDVLKRTLETSLEYKPNVIIRLTGDNPFVDKDIMEYMIKYFSANYKNLDYLCNNGFGNFNKRKVSPGIDIQMYKMSSFLKMSDIIYKLKINKKYLEHPPLYFYTKGKNIFKIKNIELPTKYKVSQFRSVTVDRIDDFKKIKKIYSYFKKKNNVYFSLKNLEEYFDKID